MAHAPWQRILSRAEPGTALAEFLQHVATDEDLSPYVVRRTHWPTRQLVRPDLLALSTTPLLQRVEQDRQALRDLRALLPRRIVRARSHLMRRNLCFFAAASTTGFVNYMTIDPHVIYGPTSVWKGLVVGCVPVALLRNGSELRFVILPSDAPTDAVALVAYVLEWTTVPPSLAVKEVESNLRLRVTSLKTMQFAVAAHQRDQVNMPWGVELAAWVDMFIAGASSASGMSLGLRMFQTLSSTYR